MKVTRNCPFLGVINHKEIDVTQQQLDYWIAGALIQDVMPHLSLDDREFIISGTTPEMWDKYMGEDE